jgi:hypothetical protein
LGITVHRKDKHKGGYNIFHIIYFKLEHNK